MKLARLLQVSLWGPETLRESDASARAKHQQATIKKALIVTTERINMLNTLKRKIALGAVAAVGAAGLVTIAAPAANAAAISSIAATVSPFRAGTSATSATLSITAVGTETSTVRGRFTAVPATAPAAADSLTAIAVGDTLTSTTDQYFLSATAKTVSMTPGKATVAAKFAVAGTYTAIIWVDTTNNGVIDANESYTTVNIGAGGTPTSISVSPATKSVAGTAAATYGVTLKDATGNITLLNQGETVTILSTITTPTVLTGAETVTVTPATQYAAHNVVTGSTPSDNPAIGGIASTDTATLGVYSLSVASTSGTAPATATITMNLGGSLNPVTPVTATFSSGAVAKATSIKASNATGLTKNQFKFSAPVAAADTATITQTLFASPTLAPVLTYALVGTASTTVNVTVSAGAGGLPTGVTAGTYPVVLDATGAGTFTITPTSAVAGTGVVVTSAILSPTDSQGQTASLTTTYASSTVSAQAAGSNGIALTPDLSTVSASIATVGATTTIGVVVKDQYGTPQPYYTVRGSLSTTSRNAAVTITDAITGADGTASVTFKDASTSTTVLSDVLTVSVFPPASATSAFTNNTNTGPTLTITYSSTGAFASLALTGGTTAAATVTQAIPSADGTVNAITITPSLKDSLGAPVTGVALVYTGSDGVKFRNGTTTVATDLLTTTVGSNGAVTAYGTKPGTATVTVKGGGLTATASWTVSKSALAHTVGLTAVGSKVTATVKDGFGNPVSGVTLNLATTDAGVFGAGVTSTSVVTDATGAASAVVSSADGKAGSATVSATYNTGGTNETAFTADQAVTGQAAGVASATATVALVASAATSGDAATAAAQKATDAKIADIATAVTNLSTTVAGLVASLVAQIKDTKAAITATQDALTALAAVVNKIKAKVKA